ncbi:MAG: glycosyltransferase family 2 protein [Prevotellaceae bacterium]|jgi:glycosyltransferase involved in cell wall biosynthesis|nr:glycosyltransferase family 2 protein [Prevotellaceae bacterium]
MKTLSIIIPAYNEEKTIVTVLQKVAEVELINGMQKEIIVVNDYSRDATEQLALDYKAQHPELALTYFKLPANQGKGAAIRYGVSIASGDYIIVQDADLEYDPSEFNILLKPVVDGHADVVYGSRLIGGRPHRILFFWHTIGNKLLTFLSNAFTNLNLSDMETCYKLFDASMLKSIDLKENRFGFEPEVTAKISRIPAVRIYEVGISYYGRTYADGKKIHWKDGVRTIYCILKYNIFCK